MSKPETNGKRRGFVPKLHARPAMSFVDVTQKRIEKIAYAWDEIDPSMSRACDDLAAALRVFARDLDSSIEVMNEPADQD